MRFRLLWPLFLIYAVTFSQPSFAQDVVVTRSGVVEQYKGKPYYIHFVSPGETVTAITKAYNVSMAEVSAENPGVEKGLKADMVLRIPQKPLGVVPESSAQQVEKPSVQSKTVTEPKVQPKPVVEPKEQTKAVPDPDKQAKSVLNPTDQTNKGLNANDQTKVVVKPDVQTKPNLIPQEQSKPVEDSECFLYLVKKQETFYGISHQFNLTVEDVQNANPGITGLQEGTEIRIPRKKPAVKPVPAPASSDKTGKTETNPEEIVAKSGETLYSIAKAHNTTVDEIIDLNPQLSGGLKAGMVIRLRKPVVKSETKPEPRAETDVTVKPVKQGECYDPLNIGKTYEIALLLPFLLDDAGLALEAPEQKDPSEFKNFNYFQFYAGFMLAADSLQQYGLHARIHVLDADMLNDTLTIRQTLRKPGMDKMDLLVGPMYASSFTVAARFANRNKIGIINPLSQRESIVDKNPFVVKTQVAGSGISAKLASFISKTYPGANIIAVRNDKKELKAVADDFSSRVKASIASRAFSGSLLESVFSTDMISGVTKKLKPGVKNIVVFFSNNKNNVPNFVSLLNPNAKSNDIVLIGMEGWDELDLETEFLVNLNYHQVTSGFIDYESEAVKQFVARFRNKYGAVPLSSEHAFLGYDIGWHFLTSLMWYGDQYMECVPGNAGKGLQLNFSFSAARSGDGLQNMDVSIVKLQDYKMVKVE